MAKKRANTVIAGLLIDPANKSIQEVNVRYDEHCSVLKSMYENLQCSCVDVGRRCVEYLPSAPQDDLWFDDEGSYSDCEYAFQLPYCVPLIGRGLILGYDGNGNCTSHHLTAEDIEMLKQTIVFHRREV